MKLSINFKKTIFFAVFVSALFFISANALAVDAKTEPKIVSPFDVLQVEIPGLDALLKTDEAQVKCTGEGKDKICEYPWVGIYIKAVYKFLVGISGMLAVIVMMAGGYYWLFSGGNAGRVTQAKEYIGGAVMGLALALGSYMILNLINPDLLSLKALRIGSIPEMEIIVEGDTTAPTSGTLFENAKQVGILTSGGLEAVINSTMGKVTYGLTDKQSDKARGCVKRGDFITEGGITTICLDCSGFARYVIKAVSNKDIPYTTTDIFRGAKKVFKEKTAFNVLKMSDINNILTSTAAPVELKKQAAVALGHINELGKLPAGVLIGWGGDDGHPYGHVLISMGNGLFAQSRSSDNITGNGRKAGNAVNKITAEQLYANFGDEQLKIYTP